MMEAKKGRAKRRRCGRDEPALRVVRIDCKPAPDAEARLRRIFTLLLARTAREELPPPRTDSRSMDGDGAEG